MRQETKKTIEALVRAVVTDKNEREEFLALLSRKPEKRDKLLTTREACELAGVGSWKVLRAWELAGKIHAVRPTSHRVRWRRSELERFLCMEGVEA